MTNIKYLEHWINQNKLSLISKTIDKIFEIEDFGLCYLLEEKQIKKEEKGDSIENKLFDEEFDLIIDPKERKYVIENNVDYYVYNFGGNFFYTKITETKKPKLKIFKYIGKCNQIIGDIEFVPLGVHGKYEIFKGTRDYNAWCKKASFLGFNKLGLCEKNTLAGLMQFQLNCEKNGIKSILGETISIKTKNGDFFEGKTYIKNEAGWENLLTINKIINVDNNEENFIEEIDLLKLGKGLWFIFTEINHLSLSNIQKYKNSFENIYFQIDSVIWESNDTDEKYLLGLQSYISNYRKLIEPILINDAYYLDKEDNHIIKFLNKLKGGHHKSSSDQYFKNLDDVVNNLSSLFGDDDSSEQNFQQLILSSIKNTVILGEENNFKIETKEFKLPKFENKGLESKYSKFTNNEDLFKFLIEESFKQKEGELTEEIKKVWEERILLELDLIHRGNYFDYFLILWDIVNWCKKENILIGIGRGSAGGSLISYLLGITKVDPIQFDLLFSRFLSEGRLGKSLPDIDLDFENRDAVINYMRERYGENHVCSVGSYTTFQLKQALKDLAKQKGLSFNIINELSKLIHIEDGEWDDLFLTAIKKPLWRDFIKKHSDIINDILLILHQPKAKSIHACATLILPKFNSKGEEIDIFKQIPVRKEGDILVSEWEGEELADAGYLKEDILGLKQLEKFKNILNLIKKTTGKDIDIYNLPLDDRNVYDKLFKNGYNSDVFHLGTKLLKAYSQEVKPDTIEDLIAMLALVRPGAVKSGANMDYVRFKSGKKEPTYDFGLKEITKNTYGLFIYQEQIMQVCESLGGFSGSEAEDVRKAMGKLRKELIEVYENKFIKGAIQNGCPAEEAQNIWDKMVGFASYGFNRSHSACYAITGYISQWLKYYYPLQFWTTAFEFADNDDKIMSYISEIKKIDDHIKIIPPDINNSKEELYTDFKQSKIYWSLTKIDSLGPVAVRAIIEEREKNGVYFSLEEFYKRVKKAEVNKRIIEHLILAGAFDEIEKIEKPIDRIELVFKFYDIAEIKEKNYNLIFIEEGVDKEYWWLLKQREVSGLAYFDYKKIIEESKFARLSKIYCDEIYFFNSYSEGKKVSIGGIITAIEERGSKNGKFGQIYLDSNDEQIIINYWSKLWVKDNILFTSDAIGKILLISGRVAYSSFSKQNVLQVEDNSELMFLS